VFIAQRCTNLKGRFVSVQAIHRGGRRGSIIIPEGWNSNGWRGFALELRRILFPETVKSQNHQTLAAGRPANSDDRMKKSFVAVVSSSGETHGGKS
jgi:hypothetical protein